MKVCCQDGACLEGISVELSQSGMSAMIQGAYDPAKSFVYSQLQGSNAAAVVRHKLGMLYGFEFLELARSSKLEKSPSDAVNASRGGSNASAV